MKLHSLPLSPYAARVRAAIYAKRLPVEIVAPPDDWRTSPSFAALNPMRRVPVLELDDGTGLAESGVIVEYLEDAFPEPSLRPRSALGVARVRLITQVADLYVMQALMPLFGLLDTKTRDAPAIEAQFGRLEAGLKLLNAMLDADAYAHGHRLSTADLWLASVRFSLDALMAFSGRSTLLDRYKSVAAYAGVVRRDAALGRIWQEMSDALNALMAARAASAGRDAE
ncbi:MAG TPA: glutathione S-transferase family protein [Vineibacter sp.]|nr:glutathione S-transferase family protein [Vineibacter sp.]